MTIEEIKKARRELEQKVGDALAAFRSETGLMPRRVEILTYEHRPLGGECSEMVAGVRIEVDLGL